MSIETAIERFARRIQQENLAVEGVAVADQEKVICERRFTPGTRPRNLYSNTKSFTSTAVGIALTEGKLGLTDHLVDYFPELVPEDPHPWLLKITLRDLLMMSSGFGRMYLGGEDCRRGVGAPDYLPYMMGREMVLEPGTKFIYSNGDTVLAGRMVSKAVGISLGEYVRQKLFAPLDLGWPVWEHDPTGHAFEASGLYLTLTDMMKLGQLYISEGVWKGTRLLSQEWIAQATSKQIDTEGPSPSTASGYGYQMWMNPFPNSARADGAFGQLTIMLPRQGLVVGIQCPETGDFERVRPVLFEDLLPEIINQVG